MPSSPKGVLPDPPRNREVSRPSLRGALVWFVIAYGVAIAGYLAQNALASRFLGGSSFGYFVIVVTVTTVIGQFALLGVHRAGLREAARLSLDEHEALDQLRRGVRAVCLVSLPVAGLLSGAVALFVWRDKVAHERWELSVAVVLLVILSGHQKLWANYLRGFGHVRFASVLEGRSGGALVAVLQSLLVGAVWAFWPGLGLTGALSAIAVGYLIPVLIAYRVVARNWSQPSSRKTRVLRDLRRVFDRDWRFASGQLASYLNGNLELFMAGFLLSAVDTSLFSAAQRLSLLLVTPLTSLQVVFSPVIARTWADGNNSAMQSLVRTGATVAAVPMLLVCVPIFVIPHQVLDTVFGSGYAPAAAALLLLTVGSLANVVTGLCGAVLSMTHNEGTVATVNWIGLGVRLVLGIAAGLIFGLNGLGASAGIVTAGIWIALWIATRRLVGVQTFLTPRPRLGLLRDTLG